MNVQKARRDTPGCRHVLHFNNAGASLMPEQVVEACMNHLHLESRIGGYEAADEARGAIEHTYDALASLLHCTRDEIALFDSATRAWDQAFYSLPLRSGDHILTAEASYASNYIGFLHRKQQEGIEIDVAPSDDSGQVDVEALERKINDRTRLIALTHVPTNGGLVNPAEDVGRIARNHGVPFLLDACQSAGQMPLDVEKLKCDMLSATGRKFLRAPRGTGFLYVRSRLIPTLEPPTPDLHAAEWTSPSSYRLRDDARRFELWESNAAAAIGMGVAVDYARQWGLEAIRQRVTTLADELRTRVSKVPGATVRDAGRTKCAIVTFDIANADAAELKSLLRARSINVSISEPQSTLLDARSRSLPEMIRASVHYYNTEDEIDRFIAAVTELVA